MKQVKYKYPYKSRVRKSPITKELKEKHKKGNTLSPLDITFKQKLITLKMHYAANYLIYLCRLRVELYHLKSQVSSVYNFNKCSKNKKDELWIAKKNAVLKDAINLLQQLRCHEIVLNICVYERTPSFLFKKNTDAILCNEYNKFCLALTKLSQLFEK